MGGQSAWTREVGLNARTREQPSTKERITLASSASRLFIGELLVGIVAHPPTRLSKANSRPHRLCVEARHMSSSFVTPQPPIPACQSLNEAQVRLLLQRRLPRVRQPRSVAYSKCVA